MAERGDWTQATFTCRTFDELPLCTATSENTCQIVDHLSTLNELLFHAELELQERPAPCGQLSLESLAEEDLCMPHDSGKTFKQAITLMHRLLKTHSCIKHVHIHHGLFSLHAPLVCDALKSNHSTRTINIDFKGTVFNQAVDAAFTSVDHMEELERLDQGSCDELSLALSTVIRVCSSLTTLRIPELRMKGGMATSFVAVLKENFTLEELSMHGSVICEAGRDQFAQYLRDSTSLTTLSITADDSTRRNCFNWMAQGLLVSKAVKKVYLNNVLFDEENAGLAARIFTENKILQSFNITYLPRTLSLMPRTDYNLWYAPLSNNETLEELCLPFSIWNSAQWVDFFWTVSRKQSLKKLTVFVHATARCHLRELCKALKESGAEEKVSLGTYVVYYNLDLIYSKAFSDVDLFCFGDVVGQLSRVLVQFPHITSVRFSLRAGDVLLASAIAAYVKAARSLRKVRLTFYSDWDGMEEDKTASWTEIVASLSRNTSIRELGLHMDIDPDDSDDEDDVIHLIKLFAQAIKTSPNIRTVHFSGERSHEVAAFLRHFSEDIADNHTLVCVTIGGILDRNAARDYFNVRDTARRNFGLVTCAAQFTRGRALDRNCARALERVWRHTGLLEELAEQVSLSVAEASTMVRCGLRSVEGLHDFMRLARVVRDCVVCNPRPDGRPQLDTLNEDCWRLVRRYLALDDVREVAASASYSQR
ncbi:hypothetical protein HPB49_003850 [Dermacentor silvarum]|uniref:Uncharacterized protein n=2 Tax=Dermacentor silvarum TaxID=543639 RepID=A0ACB8CPP7_DERSI|nr:hypothetical protein HPB49_003850 [Dermacentor silvarum]